MKPGQQRVQFSVPTSERLTFKRAVTADQQVLHALVTDPHIKQFLFDGDHKTEDWTRVAIEESGCLFEQRQIGLWLLLSKSLGTPVGFCGFRHFPRYGQEPQLLYAFPEEQSGKGLASECALAMVSFVRDIAGAHRIESAVDTPNVASKRILEKVGFQRVGEIEGTFGAIITYELVL